MRRFFSITLVLALLTQLQCAVACDQSTYQALSSAAQTVEAPDSNAHDCCPKGDPRDTSPVQMVDACADHHTATPLAKLWQNEELTPSLTLALPSETRHTLLPRAPTALWLAAPASHPPWQTPYPLTQRLLL